MNRKINWHLKAAFLLVIFVLCSLYTLSRRSLTLSSPSFELPMFDYQPKPYNGPSGDEVLAKRQKYLGSSLFYYYKKPEVGIIYTHQQKTVMVDAAAGDSKRKIIPFHGGLHLCDGRYDTPQHPIFSTLEMVHKDDHHNPTFAVLVVATKNRKLQLPQNSHNLYALHNCTDNASHGEHIRQSDQY